MSSTTKESDEPYDDPKFKFYECEKCGGPHHKRRKGNKCTGKNGNIRLVYHLTRYVYHAGKMKRRKTKAELKKLEPEIKEAIGEFKKELSHELGDYIKRGWRAESGGRVEEDMDFEALSVKLEGLRKAAIELLEEEERLEVVGMSGGSAGGNGELLRMLKEERERAARQGGF